jgi:hypothetical protein
MTVPTLVRILQARGITLWLDGERVRGRVLKGRLTASDPALLTAHRTTLVTWLRQQTAGEGSADPGTTLPEPPCPPHVPYEPLPSEGPLRQCQTCPHVWYVACPCGDTHWQWYVETETWCCRACGAWYGGQSTAPLPRDEHLREATGARQGKEGA